MAITLLSHLSAKYSNFYSSLITSGRLNEVTWEELVPMLLYQEERFQQQVKDGSPEALAGCQHNSPYKGKGKPQQQNSEGKEGNKQSRPQKTKEDRDALKAQRYYCGEKDHYWRQCPKRGESSTTPSHTVQQLPAYVHLEVLNDEPSPLSASVETVLTT